MVASHRKVNSAAATPTADAMYSTDMVHMNGISSILKLIRFWGRRIPFPLSCQMELHAWIQR